MIVLPGDLSSPTAGALLRRGAPVIVRFDAHASIHGVCLMAGVVAVRDGGLADIYDVGVGEIYDIAPDQVGLDLSDSAGMDLAARWLARHHGLTVGATAPRWERRADDESPDTWEWTLSVDDAHDVYFGRQFGFVPGACCPVNVNDITDPAAALRLACLAAAGRVE